MFNLKKLIRPNILSLKAYSSARDEYKGKSGIFLDANENPFGKYNRYPDPYQIDLKEKLAEYKQTSIENIFVGNGSDEIIDLTFRIFCEPGKDKVLTFSPTYGMYDVSANINNVEVVKIPLDQNFQINLVETQKCLTDPNLKVIFICSPNNPTGNTINEESIEYLLNNFNGLIFIDEAYIDFSKKNSWIKNIEQFPNLIVSQTFSKAWGLAAARVGIAYANTEILSFYNKVKPPYNVSKLNQEAAINALNNIDQFHLNKTIILNEKSYMLKMLQELNIVKNIYPTDSNFILLEVQNANKIYQRLIQKKIIVRNRNSEINNCIRISIGTKNENQQLINALKNLNQIEL